MRCGVVAWLVVWGCLVGAGCSSQEDSRPSEDAGLIEAPVYRDGGDLGDGGRDCGACAVPCQAIGGGGEVQMGLDQAGLWSADVPCTRNQNGTVCQPTVFLNKDPDGGMRVLGRYPGDGGSGVPVLAVADEEALFFHDNYWKEARSVYELPRSGGPAVEAFSTPGRVTLVGIDAVNVYTLEEEPSDAGVSASLRLVAHERTGGGAATLAGLPAETGKPIAGAFKAEELLVLRQQAGLAAVLEHHVVGGGQPSWSRAFASGVMDIAFEGQDAFALEMTGQAGLADLVRVRRDGETEVLLRSAPVSARDTPDGTQLAVGGDSVVLAHKDCGGRGQMMCPLTGEVYRVSLASGKQEDLCRGNITPLQVVTDGSVIYVKTSTGLLELRPDAR